MALGWKPRNFQMNPRARVPTSHKSLLLEKCKSTRVIFSFGILVLDIDLVSYILVFNPKWARWTHFLITIKLPLRTIPSCRILSLCNHLTVWFNKYEYITRLQKWDWSNISSSKPACCRSSSISLQATSSAALRSAWLRTTLIKLASP